MKNFLRVAVVLLLVFWVVTSFFELLTINPARTVDMIQKEKPGAKVEFSTSDLKLIDIMLTRDREWTTVLIIDGKPAKVLSAEKYWQPFPLGWFVGLGKTTTKILEVK